MTDGEGRARFHYAEREEVRVPIPILYEPAPQHEDTGDEEQERGDTWSPSEMVGTRTQGNPGLLREPPPDPAPDLASDEEEQQPYPALAPVVFFCVKQTTRPRSWCLRMVCNPYPLLWQTNCHGCLFRSFARLSDWFCGAEAFITIASLPLCQGAIITFCLDRLVSCWVLFMEVVWWCVYLTWRKNSLDESIDILFDIRGCVPLGEVFVFSILEICGTASICL